MMQIISAEASKAANIAMLIPGQIHRAEALYLYTLARQKGPLVEIGCLHGRSTSILIQASRAYEAEVTTVDPFIETPNTQSPSSEFWRSNLEEHGLRVPTLFEMKSHEAAPLYTGEIGLLFVDGGHSYETVAEDIREWSGKIKLNGIIAFHDTWHPAIPEVTRAIIDWWLPNSRQWKPLERVDYISAFRRMT